MSDALGQVQLADRDAVARIKLPPAPIPTSWGRVVAPYVPPGAACAAPGDVGGGADENVDTNGAAPRPEACAYVEVPQIAGADFKDKAIGRAYQVRPRHRVMLPCSALFCRLPGVAGDGGRPSVGLSIRAGRVRMGIAGARCPLHAAIDRLAQ
jgi:hypothetical protein